MNQSLIIKTALAAALGLALTAIPSPADAQRSTAERQAAREAREDRGSRQTETLFPNATRQSPTATVSQRMAPRVQRLDDMLEGPENAQEVVAEAQRLINDRNANAYVKSIAYVRMADAYEELGDWDNSFASLERALEEDGFSNDNHYQTMLRLGQTLVIEERTDQGLAWLARFFEESRSERPEHLALMGNVYYQAERFPEAVEYINRAIAVSDSPNPQWNQILMASYAEMGQGEEAVRVATELAATDPSNKQLVMNLASAHLQADNYEQAAEVLQDARRRGLFDSGQDYRHLASILLNTDNQEAQAASVLQEGLDNGMVEGDFDTYFMLGQAYYFSDQYDGAIGAWTEAAKTAPNGEAALNLARVHYDEGNWEEARRYANEAISKGVSNEETARNLIRNVELEMRR